MELRLGQGERDELTFDSGDSVAFLSLFFLCLTWYQGWDMERGLWFWVTPSPFLQDCSEIGLGVTAGLGGNGWAYKVDSVDSVPHLRLSFRFRPGVKAGLQ